MKEIEAELIGAMIVGRNSDSSIVDNIVEDVERMEKTERGESRESGGRDERSNKKGEREEWI